MITASAPGKLILLGEHAVVYGKPAVALAIDRRFACSLETSDEDMLNGRPADFSKHPYIHHMLRKHGVTNVAIDTVSDIPAGSGLGSSAALSVSVSAAIRSMKGESVTEEDIAMDAFDTEYEVQGRASPVDSSASTHGKGIVVNGPGERLWSASRGGNAWDISEIDIPDMTLVVGYTGLHAPTGPLVEKVRKFREKNRFGYDIVEEIGVATLEGINALGVGDIARLGELMSYDHKLLTILGVSCAELDKLVNAVSPYSYGAKLTGAGGGGSMISLTDRPDKVCEVIERRGGQPFAVRTNVKGVSVLNRS